MITDSLQRALVEALGSRPRVGAFVVQLDPTSDNPFRNYAAPDPSSAAALDLGALAELFRAEARMPRLEYVEPNEALAAALLDAGFVIERRLPLLVLGADGVLAAPVPLGAVVSRAEETDLLAAAAAMARAYGDDEPAERGAERLRGTLRRGGSVSVGVLDGTVVSAGLHGAPIRGLAEIAAIATLPEYRRRGLAALVAADLAGHAVGLGARPYLQAEGEAEARMYERIGFERCGSLVLANGS